MTIETRNYIENMYNTINPIYADLFDGDYHNENTQINYAISKNLINRKDSNMDKSSKNTEHKLNKYFDTKSNSLVTATDDSSFIDLVNFVNGNIAVRYVYVKPKQIKSFSDDKTNTKVVKILFADGTSTTAICKCNNDDWYDTGVMICLAKRYIGWNNDSKTSAFNKIVDYAMKIEKNRVNKEKLDNEKKEAEKLRHKKYIEKKNKRKLRKNERRNNNE